jgi:DNA-binding GntR family transcriptional regulator
MGFFWPVMVLGLAHTRCYGCHMNSLKDILKPIGRGDGRRTAIDVYDKLLASILSGQLQPGTIVSQVQLAGALKVSRTPVREAMRMLQESGLLVGEPNYRSRVVGFDPQDIEALYMKRVALEALGVAITTRRITPEGAKELRALVKALESKEAHDSFEKWQILHRQLHRLIVAEAGSALTTELEQLELRSERYQSTYKGAHLVGWWQRGEAEHRELIEAMCAGDVALSGELAARHLARTALELLAALAPEYDTLRLRVSLKFAIDGAARL